MSAFKIVTVTVSIIILLLNKKQRKKERMLTLPHYTAGTYISCFPLTFSSCTQLSFQKTKSDIFLPRRNRRNQIHLFFTMFKESSISGMRKKSMIRWWWTRLPVFSVKQPVLYIQKMWQWSSLWWNLSTIGAYENCFFVLLL